ncbi:MAG: DUF3237 domain-containing protein [SAR324 cluster bacterium]
MLDYKLEHIVSFTGQGGKPPELIGQVPEGVRINFCNGGGEFNGPALRGKLRDSGGDWMTVRTDGVALLDARVTFETHDGALILVTYPGMIDFGEGGHARFLKGELPAVARIRTSPRFLTGHPAYAWLNRLHCVGIGEYRSATRSASYEVYAVR